MIRNFCKAIVFTIAALASVSLAHAQEEPTDYEGVPAEESCWLAEETAGGAWDVDMEILFLQFNGALGTRANDVFDFDTAARFAASYTACNGVGVRGTYFDYDHTGVDPGAQRIDLNTYSVDFEIFKLIDLGECTTLEISGGVRYLNTLFSQPSVFEPNNFDGLGVIVGGRATAAVGTGGSVYARGKFAILAGAGSHDSNFRSLNPANDVGRSQIELGVGYEHTFAVGRFVITPSLGAEVQNWGTFTVDPVDEHPEGDFVLAGFVAGLNVSF